MALGVTYRAIQTGTRLPDGLMLSYPALNLSKEHYTPSLLYSFIDEFVPYSFLEACLASYLNEMSHEASSNFYISPQIVSDSILEK